VVTVLFLNNEELRTDADRIMDLLKAMKQA